MSSTQHEALKLADEIDCQEWFSYAQTADTIRKQHALIEQLAGALDELAELMELVRTGDYKPDSFTNQPANTAIAAAKDYLK